MPLTNDFKPFATDGGASVESQAAYAADPTTGTGFSAGTAEHLKCNKVWRQGSFGAAVLMQYIAETLNSDSLDDGDLAAHVDRLRDALSAGASNPIGLSALRGAQAFNNASAPNSKVDINAAEVVLRDANAKLTHVVPGGAITLDTGAAGVNGYDSTGPFGNNNWIYTYLIFKPAGAVLATYASLTPPSTFDGSTLPAGYTSWAYVEPIYKNGSGNIVGHELLGNRVSYQARQQVLNAGAATVETGVSVASVVPPDAMDFQLETEPTRQGTNVNDANAVARLRWKTLQDYRVHDITAIVSGFNLPWPKAVANLQMPNVGQQFLYRWDGAANGRSLSAWVQGFRIANGGG